MTWHSRRYRVRAVVHIDTGLRHPDVGPLVAYDRRLSYHRTDELARRRFDEILDLNGRRMQDGPGSYAHYRVAWVEAAEADPDEANMWHVWLSEAPPKPDGWCADPTPREANDPSAPYLSTDLEPGEQPS